MAYINQRLSNTNPKQQQEHHISHRSQSHPYTHGNSHTVLREPEGVSQLQEHRHHLYP